MAQKPRLYLHIGHPKTASSTLQAFLYKNWDTLEAAGFSLPTAEFGMAQGSTRPDNPLWALQRMRETGDISLLAQWIEASGKIADKLILSSECLIQPEWPELFSDIPNIADIHLIYYVRRQDQLLLSAWRQWGLKRGLSLDEFLKRRQKNQQPNFMSIVENWATQLSISTYHVRFINKGCLEGGSVVSDLCHCIGLGEQTLQTVADQNISIDARLALYLSQHAELFDSVHDEEIFTLLRDKDTPEPEVRLALNEDQFEGIHSTFEPLNQLLLEQYHPAAHGTPIIEKTSAPIGDLTETANTAAQRSYIEERLAAVGNPSSDKLTRLREILAEKSNA